MTEFLDDPHRRCTLKSTQSATDTANLQAGIGGLSLLVIGSTKLDALLFQVATFAVHAIPGADGAGLTLLRTHCAETRVESVAASHPFVTALDAIQHSILNEGPSITAVLERRTARSGSLGGEPRWPRFGPRAGRLGVHSALALPLLVAGLPVGAISAYAYGKDAFDDRAIHAGELFAVPAAVSVRNAQLLAHSLARTDQLQSALSSRPVIEQAIGLLRGRSGSSTEEAFSRLRAISQTEHIKLIDVAQHIVDDAVRRARARQRPRVILTTG